jgi:hypothetical protein
MMGTNRYATEVQVEQAQGQHAGDKFSRYGE